MSLASLRDGLQLAICPSINGGGGTVPDLSGRHNHAVLTNMDANGYRSYTNGLSFNFDGNNDYAACNLVPGLSGNVTVSGFFRLASADANTRFCCGNAQSGGAVIETHLEAVNNSFGPLWGSNPYYRPAPNLGITSGVWYHVAMVRRGVTGAWTAEMYLNGSFAWSGTTSINPGAASVWSIGRSGAYVGPGGTYFSGQLDDQRLYSRVLSPQEIRLLAQEPGIGLWPERTSVFFGTQLLNAAWAPQSNVILSPVGAA